MKIFLLSFLLFFSLHAEDKLNANFSNLSVIDFIQLVSTVSNKNILNNYEIEGFVDLSNGSSIPESEFLDILLSVLKSKGYSLVDKGSFLEIVKSEELLSNNPNFLKSAHLLSSSFIKIKNSDVDSILEKIKPLASFPSSLISFKKSNMLLITDYPQNIKTIKNIIDNIDFKDDYLVKKISIKNVSLPDVFQYLTDVSSILFNKELSSDNIKIIKHDSQNSIIIVGIQNNIDKLTSLVVEYDIASNSGDTTQIFNLKNSNAKEVLESLTKIIDNQKYLDETSKPNISMSEDINSIIVVSNPISLKLISSFIAELDKEKYQVYVEARIFEINEDSSKALGIKWGFDGSKLFSNGGLLSFSSAFGGLDVSQNFSSTIASTFVGNGFALGASLDFLQTNGASKSISNPSILCVNNKESFIYVGKTISVSTGSSSSAVSGVTNSFARENVGLTLKITPRVSSDEKVTLDISAVIANLLDDGSNNATRQPVTSKQEVNTQAILRHGEHIIIGGLVKSYNVDFINRVPFLSNIPYVGDILFTSRSSTTQRDNLVVILTPYIIDKSEKLSKLQDDLGILSKMQEKYNIQIFNHIKQNGLKVD